jgi:predicted permease
MPDWKPEIRARLSGLNLGAVRGEEIVEEISQHLDDRFAALRAGGATEEEARLAALEELGNEAFVARELPWVEPPMCPEPVVLGESKGNLLDNIYQDLRFGLRMFRKNPGFTAVAVLTLALGIGANTAIFSVMNKFVVRPLPVEDPARVVSVNDATEGGQAIPFLSYPNYRDLRDRNEVTSGLVAYQPVPVSLSCGDHAERVWGYLVSGNYFALLGGQAAVGRLISPVDDGERGAHPVVVVSHRCWQQRFGGDPALVGRSVVVNGRSFAVIGVAPAGFAGLELSYVPEVWFPLAMGSEFRSLMPGAAKRGGVWMDDRKAASVCVAGRLKTGISVARAEASFKDIAAQLASEHPDENQGRTFSLSQPGVWGAFGRGWLLGFSGALMGVAGLVLLLVCTNLANLLLVRGMDRRQEVAVRLALGANRGRVVRQLLTESLLLSLGGGACGLIIAWWMIHWPGTFKVAMPISIALDMDWRVLSFSFAITLVASVTFGLLPALRSTKPDLVPALKNQNLGSASRISWLRNSLVVAQVALSLVLMISAGLVLRGLLRLQSTDPGFIPRHAVKVSFDLDLQGYNRDSGGQFQQQLLERLRALPGVEAAGLGSFVPPDMHVMTVPVYVEGKPRAQLGETPRCGTASASPGYFQALGMRLLRGRDFTSQDDQGSPRVAVINKDFARRFWPDEDAIGKRFTLSDDDGSPIQVVGIVQDSKYRRLTEDPLPFAFVPMKQSFNGLTMLVVRMAFEPAQVIADIRHELHELDPHLPIFDLKTLAEHLSSAQLPASVAASMLGGFGALSLVLAGIGIFGVMVYTAGQRAREIGIRMALGAPRAEVLGLLLGHGMTLVLLGVAFGLAGALALTRLMSSLLTGVSSTDVPTFASVALVLVAVALLACYFPARRAANMDPMAALRTE